MPNRDYRSLTILSSLTLFTVISTAAIATENNSPCSGTPLSCSYTLKSDDLKHFFPNAEDPINATFNKGLPPFYPMQDNFPQTLEDSIIRFTKSSLDRDQIPYRDVSVNKVSDQQVTVTISDTTEAAAGYATVMPQFVANAELGLQGVVNAVNDPNTWYWNPKETQMKSNYNDGKLYQDPWAFYLPLGLPVVNQKSVMLLNYPPADSLCATDYLKNFTMDRWSSVLTRVGIDQKDTALYETIVDTHPIAAPGSGMGTPIANTTKFFTDFDNAMLNLATAPPGAPASNSAIPLVVSGSAAHDVWGKIIGKTVKTGDHDIFTLPGQSQPIPWIATNHPDVTTYQVCPGDNSKKVYSNKSNGPSCSFTGTWDVNKQYYDAFNAAQEKIHPTSTATKPTPRKHHSKQQYSDDALVSDELLDLVSACAVKEYVAKMGDNNTPRKRLDDAYSYCQSIWCTEENGNCKVQQTCVQGRLDYDFTSVGHCKCEQAAVEFCADNNNQICPDQTQVTSCEDYNERYCGDNASNLANFLNTWVDSINRSSSGANATIRPHSR